MQILWYIFMIHLCHQRGERDKWKLHLYHCNRDWRNGWWRWVMEVEMVVVMEVEMVVEMAVEID